MKYIILEMQTNADGTVGTIVTAKDELNEAMSTYYSILAAAALSSLPVHAAVLMSNDGATLRRELFDRREEA